MLIQLLVVLVVVGFGLWLLTTLVPMEPRIKTAIVGVVLLLAFLYVLSALTGHQFLPGALR